METPSSARRITRSQAMAAASNTSNNIPMSRKFEESEKGTVPKSRQRSGKQQGALIDITNDSPIVGLAMGSLETPSSAFSKKRTVMGKNNKCSEVTTPGSGEALLRGQVKTLLQKVEEEAVISKISSLEYKTRFPLCQSPMTVLAPTPANTPQVSDLSANNVTLPSPRAVVVEQSMNISQMLIGRKKEEESDPESDHVLVTRSLLLDFSDKSDSSDCISVLTFQGCENKARDRDDDDDSSVWSVQVNASTRDEEEQDGDDEGSLLVDQLCEGMSKISVNGQYFCGKHTRFVYDSDNELVGEEEEDGDGDDDQERDESWSSSSSS